MNKCICLLCLISFLCFGCSYVQVEKGSFDAMVPSAYIGSGLPLKRDSSVWKANVSIRNYTNQKLHLHGIENDSVDSYEYNLPAVAADIYYDLKTFPVTVSIDYFTKIKDLVGGIGFGLNPYPYGRMSGGINESFFEWGLFVSLGYANVSYSTYSVYVIDQFNFAGAGSSSKGTIDCDDCSEWKFNGGFGTYLNFFPYKDITLSYSLSAYSPWLYNELKGNQFSFDLPYIFSQYFGGSYLFAEHIQASLGANVYFGNAFKEHIWNIEGGCSYIF